MRTCYHYSNDISNISPHLSDQRHLQLIDGINPISEPALIKSILGLSFLMGPGIIMVAK